MNQDPKSKAQQMQEVMDSLKETSAAPSQESPTPIVPAPGPAPNLPARNIPASDEEALARADALAERLADSQKERRLRAVSERQNQERERAAARLEKDPFAAGNEAVFKDRFQPGFSEGLRRSAAAALDIVAIPPRGAEGFVKGLYEAADWVTFDTLPNPSFWEGDKRVLGRGAGAATRFGEDIVDFGLGFWLAGAGLSKAAKFTKLTRVLSKEGVAALDKVAREQRVVADSVKDAAKLSEYFAEGKTLEGIQEAARQASKLSRTAATKALAADVARTTVAGALTDFVLVPGVDAPTAQERMNQTLWGIAIGPAMQFGGSSIVRMVRVNDTAKNLARKRAAAGPKPAPGTPLEPLPIEEAPVASGGSTAAPEVPASPKTPTVTPEAPAEAVLPPTREIAGEVAPMPRLSYQHWESTLTRWLNSSDDLELGDMTPRKLIEFGADEFDRTYGQPPGTSRRLFLESDEAARNARGVLQEQGLLSTRGFKEEVEEALDPGVVDVKPKTPTVTPEAPAVPVAPAAPRVDPNLAAMRQLYGLENAKRIVDDVWGERMENPFRDIAGTKFNPRDLPPEERLALNVRENSPNTRWYSGRKQGHFEALRALDTVSESAAGMTNRRPADWATLRQQDLQEMLRAKDVPEILFVDTFSGEPTDAILKAGSKIRVRKEFEFKIAKQIAELASQAFDSVSPAQKLDVLQQYIFGLRISAANKEALHALGATLNSMKMKTGGTLLAKDRDAALKRILATEAEQTRAATADYTHNFLLKFDPLTEKELLDPKLVQARIEELGGQDMIDGILRKASTAKGMSGAEAVALLDDAAKSMVRPSLKRAAVDLFYFGGFSGPASWARTLYGESLYGLLVRPISQSMGAGFGVAASLILDRGETTKTHARAILEGLGDMWSIFNKKDQLESLNQATQSWFQGTTRLVRNNVSKFDNMGAGVDEISGDNLARWLKGLGYTGDSMTVQRAKLAGIAYETVVKGLSRNTYLTIDAYVQQEVARTILRRHHTMEALFDLDMPLGEVGRYVDDKMGQYLRDGELQSSKVRARNAAEAAEKEAMALGLTDDKAIRDLELKKFNDMSSDIDNDALELILRRAEDAALNAPIQPGTIGAGIEFMLKHIPGGFFFQPVFKTAWNTSRLTGQLVDAPGLIAAMVNTSERASLIFPELRNGWLAKSKNAFIRDFSSDNPKIRQEALGRFVMGMTMAMFISEIATKKDEKGRPYLTGAVPKDPGMRNLWEQNGIIPNAHLDVKSGKYLDHSMFSPYSNAVSLYTDIFQMFNDPELDISPDEGAALVGAVMYPLVNALMNEPLMGGMARFMTALSDEDGSTLREKMNAIGAQTLVPNIVKQSSEIVKQVADAANGNLSLAGDVYLEEARTLFEKIKTRIPGNSLEPKRNALGEPRKGKRMVTPLFPMYVSDVSDDPLDVERLRIGSGISNFPRYQDNIDLFAVKHPVTGQSALDRWGELTSSITIGRLKLRDALNREIKRPSYRRLPLTSKEGVRTARADELNKVIEKYRARAYRQVQKEYPILRQAEAEYHILKTGRPR